MTRNILVRNKANTTLRLEHRRLRAWNRRSSKTQHAMTILWTFVVHLTACQATAQTTTNAPKCTILNIKFQNFLGGDIPEPPLREGATLSRTPPGRPTALRAFGRPAAAARPIVGTLTTGPPSALVPPSPFQNPRSATVHG